MNAYQRRRLIAVWVLSIIMAIALAMALINSTVVVGPTAAFVALAPIVVALLWTGLAWFRGAFDDKTTPSIKNSESTSIPYKMALLLEMMDEDEREAFKHQLKRDILASETGYGDFERLALEETEKRKRG